MKDHKWYVQRDFTGAYLVTLRADLPDRKQVRFCHTIHQLDWEKSANPARLLRNTVKGLTRHAQWMRISAAGS